MSLAPSGVTKNTERSGLDSLPKVAALLVTVFAVDLIFGLA